MADVKQLIQALAARNGVRVVFGNPVNDVGPWWATTSPDPQPGTVAACAVAGAAFNDALLIVVVDTVTDTFGPATITTIEDAEPALAACVGEIKTARDVLNDTFKADTPSSAAQTTLQLASAQATPVQTNLANLRNLVIAKQGTGSWPAFPGAATASLTAITAYLGTVP